MTYNVGMFTIIETPTFEVDARKIWTEEERNSFFAWLAANPEVGDPIPGSGGCRKVRWSVAGQGSAVGCESFTSPRWLMVKSGY